MGVARQTSASETCAWSLNVVWKGFDWESVLMRTQRGCACCEGVPSSGWEAVAWDSRLAFAASVEW
jgi:hypothetical protein